MRSLPATSTPEEYLAPGPTAEVNYEHWRKRCELKRPFVAVIDGQLASLSGARP